jgi:hypothetical protein
VQVAAHGKQGERALRDAVQRATESGELATPVKIWVADGKLNVRLELPDANSRSQG